MSHVEASSRGSPDRRDEDSFHTNEKTSLVVGLSTCPTSKRVLVGALTGEMKIVFIHEKTLLMVGFSTYPTSKRVLVGALEGDLLPIFSLSGNFF